jgi:YegS/Rv2252/BmrU family lipid kinase
VRVAVGEAAEACARREVAIVANLRAKRALERLEHAHALFTASGWKVAAVCALDDPCALPAAVGGLVDAGVRRIAVGGGDGTIGAVLARLVGRDSELGVLPFGTANSFARALGIPLDLPGAVRVVTAGRVERVDLGRIGNRYFATVSSLGVAAAVPEALTPALKRRLGAWSYVYAGAQALTRHRPFLCRLTWPEGELQGATLNLLVANTPYQGGVPLAPDADPRDGRLFVRVVRGCRRTDLLRAWWHALHGRAANLSFVEELTTSRLVIETDPPQRINADGELVQSTPVQVSVAPRAVAVVVPSSAA